MTTLHQIFASSCLLYSFFWIIHSHLQQMLLGNSQYPPEHLETTLPSTLAFWQAHVGTASQWSERRNFKSDLKVWFLSLNTEKWEWSLLVLIFSALINKTVLSRCYGYKRWYLLRPVWPKPYIDWLILWEKFTIVDKLLRFEGKIIPDM